MKNNQIIIDTNNSNIAYVSKAFAEKARIYGSPEFELLKNFRADMASVGIENVQIQVRGRTIKNRSAEQEKRKNLTYAHMVQFIETIGNPALMEEFETMRKRSGVQSNPRRFVQDWFIASFPNYEDAMAKIVAEEQKTINRVA